jgi:3-methyladenine DNA glycosylase/8-oxoguanine DNA glycosylase
MTRGRFKPPPYDTGAAAFHLRDSHPRMATLIERVGPCALTTHTLPPYESLVQSIVYQQLNGRAAETILGRVLAIYAPKPFPAPGDILATPDDRLRAAGLSRAKTAAVKSLAQHALEGVVPTRAQAVRLSNEELIERLTRVRGIGRWTVEMFLIFGLGRPDVWPVLDFGVRKGLGLTFRKRAVPTPKQALPFARRFTPFGSVAAWYFWRACELKPESPLVVRKVKTSRSPRR